MSEQQRDKIISLLEQRREDLPEGSYEKVAQEGYLLLGRVCELCSPRSHTQWRLEPPVPAARLGPTFRERLGIFCQKLVRTCQPRQWSTDQGPRHGSLPHRVTCRCAQGVA